MPLNDLIQPHFLKSAEGVRTVCVCVCVCVRVCVWVWMCVGAGGCAVCAETYVGVRVCIRTAVRACVRACVHTVCLRARIWMCACALRMFVCAWVAGGEGGQRLGSALGHADLVGNRHQETAFVLQRCCINHRAVSRCRNRCRHIVAISIINANPGFELYCVS